MDKRDKIILVVDDDHHVVEALQHTLQAAGYTVHTADGGAEALRVLEEQPIQLLISDHDMPGMNGLELFMRVRERHPDVCRIMITGQTDRQVMLRSINEGEVYRFIEKPWDNSVLRVTVHFAFETIALQNENRRLLQALRRQVVLSREVEQTFPGIVELSPEEEKARVSAAAPKGPKG